MLNGKKEERLIKGNLYKGRQIKLKLLYNYYD